MSSKCAKQTQSLGQIFFTGLMVFTLFTSCQRFTDDAKPSEAPVQVEIQSLHCLNGVAPALKDIFTGDVSGSQVNDAFGCLHSAMIEFREKTTDTIYSSDDLITFVNSHLLKENKIGPDFEREIMKLKVLFVGGSDQSLTKAELSGIIKINDIFGEEVQKIGPYLPLFLQNKNVQTTTTNEVDRAVAAAQSSIARLFDHMQIASTNYNLDDASSLLKELSLFVQGDELTTQLNTFRDIVPFIQLCVDAAFGNTREKLPVSELKERTSSAIRAYGYYLEYNYTMRTNELKTADELDQWIKFADRLFDLIEKKSVLASKGISFNSLKLVFEDLKARKWLPWDIKADSLDKTLRVVFQKMGRATGSQNSGSAITLDQWRNIRWEYTQWRLAQNLLAKAPFDKNGQIGIPKLLTWMKSQAPLDATLNSESWNSMQKLWLKNSWLELQTLFKQRRPIKYNTPGGIMLVDDKTISSYSQTWTDLLRFNVIRSFNRLLFLGYSNHTDLNLFSSSISEKQLIEWYGDFTPIGVDLKFFDPRSGNSGARSFLEANNFTAYSDGLGGIDYHEGYQYVSYLFAAGLVNADNIYKIMKPLGCEMSELDILGNPYLEENCFKNNLRRQFGRIFANLPGQVKFVEGMNDAQWNEYYLVLMKASRNFPTYAGQRVETSDIRTLVTISHYVESLFTQFDTNVDGILRDEEINAGSARFIPFIRTMRPGLPDMILREGFIALVVNGEIPSATALAASIWQGVTKDRTASRLNLLRVILVLKDKR